MTFAGPAGARMFGAAEPQGPRGRRCALGRRRPHGGRHEARKGAPRNVRRHWRA